MDNNTMRAFICINFPDEVIKEAARLQGAVKKTNFQGKLTELENLHLTLKFLGEIDDEKLKKVKTKLKETKFPEFEATLGIVGVFAHHKNPRIIWVKINSKTLWELQKKIDAALADLFPKEERFMGHLTLARVKYVKDKAGFARRIKSIKAKPVKFKINDFKLMKSELLEGGPKYTVIDNFNAAN